MRLEEGSQALSTRINLVDMMRDNASLRHIEDNDTGSLECWYPGACATWFYLWQARLTPQSALGTFAKRPLGSEAGTLTTVDQSVVGREWAHEGQTARLAWWHRLFAVYCLYQTDSRFILYLKHPDKCGYTMKMMLTDLDAWATQLASKPLILFQGLRTDIIFAHCFHPLSINESLE